jgi:hypothetical protein
VFMSQLDKAKLAVMSDAHHCSTQTLVTIQLRFEMNMRRSHERSLCPAAA